VKFLYHSAVTAMLCALFLVWYVRRINSIDTCAIARCWREP